MTKPKGSYFYRWCQSKGACCPGLKSIETVEFRRWWKTTLDGHYMLWVVMHLYPKTWYRRKLLMQAHLGMIVPFGATPAVARKMAEHLRKNQKLPKVLPWQRKTFIAKARKWRAA